jgi:hypothetical protein
MSARIPTSAAFTQEDRDVVADLVLYRRGAPCWLAGLVTSSYESDLNDARMMYRREKFAQQCADVQAPRMRPALYWTFYPWR